MTKLALFTAAGVLLTAAGSTLWAVPFWVVSVPLVITAELGREAPVPS